MQGMAAAAGSSASSLMPEPGSATNRLAWREAVRVSRGGSPSRATRITSGEVRPSTRLTPSPCTDWMSTSPESGALGSRENTTPLAVASCMAMTPTAISAESPATPCSMR